MSITPIFIDVLLLGGLGLGLSIVLERFLVPRPQSRRPLPAWLLHCGIWLFAYGILVLLMARPICAMVAVTAMLITLILVNNAKYKSMREPFLYHDYDYFIDTIRFPRLFLPFLGVRSFCLAAAFFVLALWGFLQETPFDRWALDGQCPAVLAVLGMAIFLLCAQKCFAMPVVLKPTEDLCRLGLLASIWAYGARARTLPGTDTPFRARPPISNAAPLPHLIAVQSESFFDPRPLFGGIKRNVLANFDAVCAESTLYGVLDVPAWGANTVRTEFAFLSGMSPQSMGVHQFHPYQAVARCWLSVTLPFYLKKCGYETICIHPHQGAFYQRDWVMPKLGFDRFLDIRSFPNAQRQGPYIADMEVAKQIEAVLQNAQRPTFIFAITMENHGPLHLEKVHAGDKECLFSDMPPEDCDELIIYLRHLRHADCMLEALLHTLQEIPGPSSLCWYGDHVPIMPRTYALLGEPKGTVPYFCWVKEQESLLRNERNPQNISVHDLGLSWLNSLQCFRHN